MRYCYEVESREEADTVAQKCQNHTLWDLDRDDKGYMMLPHYWADDTLPHMEKLIWSFIMAHYCE